MALNLANDDDGGSPVEVAQKDNADSNPGKVFHNYSNIVQLLNIVLVSWHLHPYMYKYSIH